jgi:hypothetical protein
MILAWLDRLAIGFSRKVSKVSLTRMMMSAYFCIAGSDERIFLKDG